MTVTMMTMQLLVGARGRIYVLAKTSNGVISARGTTLSSPMIIIVILLPAMLF